MASKSKLKRLNRNAKRDRVENQLVSERTAGKGPKGCHCLEGKSFYFRRYDTDLRKGDQIIVGIMNICHSIEIVMIFVYSYHLSITMRVSNLRL